MTEDNFYGVYVCKTSLCKNRWLDKTDLGYCENCGKSNYEKRWTVNLPVINIELLAKYLNVSEMVAEKIREIYIND